MFQLNVTLSVKHTSALCVSPTGDSGGFQFPRVSSCILLCSPAASYCTIGVRGRGTGEPCRDTVCTTIKPTQTTETEHMRGSKSKINELVRYSIVFLEPLLRIHRAMNQNVHEGPSFGHSQNQELPHGLNIQLHK